LLIATVGCLGLVLPPASGATVLKPWGSDLQATPNYDTANGFFSNSLPNPSNPAPGDTTAINPSYHAGDDLATWNAGSSFAAPAGGQVLQVKVKGCTWKDTSIPSDARGEQYSDGVPVNQVNFQALTRQSDGSYVEDGPTAAGFLMPFCSNPGARTTGAVNTSTISTFQPTHLCVSAGDTVGFYDIGGYIPDTGTYPNGVPFFVIAGDGLGNGSTTESFAHAEATPGPNSYPTSSPNLQSEPNEQLMMQVVEGVGDDALGPPSGCPGGDAFEPQNANNVVCVTRPTNPGDYPLGTCNASNQPVFPPQSQSPPTIAVSSNGSPVTGSPVPGNRIDVSHGSWTNNPYEYPEQWADCDANGANCTPISGATNPYYYYITGNDIGHTIRAQETAINDANTEGPASSAATAVVAGPDTPVITNLKLNPPTWNEAGSSVITYKDSEPATTTIKVLENGAVVKTLINKDNATKFCNGCSNGVKLSGRPAGSYQLQVTPNNGGTVGATSTLNFVVTSATPVITNPHVNPDTFNSARGATITYHDSQAGFATLRVLQCKGSQSSKHNKGKQNKKHKKKHGTRRTANACAQSKTVKTLHHNDRAGNNGVKLTRIPAGHYQLQIVSTYSGFKGTPVQVPVTAKLGGSKRHGVRAASDRLASAFVIA
jgi:hypothetical protein